MLNGHTAGATPRPNDINKFRTSVTGSEAISYLTGLNLFAAVGFIYIKTSFV